MRGFLVGCGVVVWSIAAACGWVWWRVVSSPGDDNPIGGLAALGVIVFGLAGGFAFALAGLVARRR